MARMRWWSQELLYSCMKSLCFFMTKQGRNKIERHSSPDCCLDEKLIATMGMQLRQLYSFCVTASQTADGLIFPSEGKFVSSSEFLKGMVTVLSKEFFRNHHRLSKR